MSGSLEHEQQSQCLGKRKRNGDGSASVHFPAEIMDRIALCLVEPFPNLRYPLRSLDRVKWDALINYHDNRDSPPTEEKYYLPNPDISTLLSLRLVSSTWNTSASRVLKQYAWWLFRFDTMDPISHVLGTLAHPRAKTSELLQLPFYLSLREDGEMMQSPIENIPRGHKNYHGRRHRYDRMLNVFNSLSRVEVLHLEFPRATSDPRMNYADVTTAGCYDLQALWKICLVMQDALNLPAFEHLTDLRLAVPVSHDVQRLGNALSQEARDRLKCLWIGLQDKTGAGGSPDYTISEWEDEDEDRQESDECMPGNLQIAFPNRRHQQELWDFVASCRNLEHLGIEATQYLHLDYMDWTPAPNSQGLKTLDLKRVYATIPCLRRLLARGTDFAGNDEENNPSVICRIALHYVKIKKNGGYWADLFSFLHDFCDDFEILRIFNLTYYSDHPSYERIGRIWEDANSIWTDNVDDLETLKRLARKLIVKAGGLEKYPRRCRELIGLDDD